MTDHEVTVEVTGVMAFPPTTSHLIRIAAGLWGDGRIEDSPEAAEYLRGQAELIANYPEPWPLYVDHDERKGLIATAILAVARQDA